MPPATAAPDLSAINSQRLAGIINTVEDNHLVIGTPGSLSIAPLHPLLLAAIAPAVTGTPVSGAAGQFTSGQTAVVQTAINQSNAAALTTPSAASGNPTTANTSSTTISTIVNGVLGGIDGIESIPEDIKTLEQGTTGTLHWWGWEADLNETATKALEDLLANGSTGIATILTALTPISAPLAAVAAAIKLVAGGLDTAIENKDQGKGVTLEGKLWIDLVLTANSN
jgi:hypothetical protein